MKAAEEFFSLDPDMIRRRECDVRRDVFSRRAILILVSLKAEEFRDSSECLVINDNRASRGARAHHVECCAAAAARRDSRRRQPHRITHHHTRAN